MGKLRGPPQYLSLRTHYQPRPAIEAWRERFLKAVDIPETETEMDRLAVCHIWTGRQHNGYGIIQVDGQQVPIQAYAYELYFEPISFYFQPGHRPTRFKPVARCMAANTPNCVNPDHLKLVERRTIATWLPPLTLAERQFVRTVHACPTQGFARLSIHPCRYARIVTFREGSDDPKDPVDNIAK